MHLPTVRVKNPAGDSFMTINVSDLTPQHEIWGEQAPGFDYSVLAQPIMPLDPHLRDVAAETMLKYLSFKLEAEGKSLSELSVGQQLEELRSLSLEVDRAREDRGGVWHQGESHSTINDDQLTSLTTNDGQTDQQNMSGVNDVSREDTSGSSVDNLSNQDPGQSGNNLPDDDGSREIGLSDVVDHKLTIENARGYFYVMDGEERVSKGFREFDDAAAERKRLEDSIPDEA